MRFCEAEGLPLTRLAAGNWRVTVHGDDTENEKDE